MVTNNFTSKVRTTPNKSTDHIAETLQDGHGFYLEGSVIFYLHGWRHNSNTVAGQLRDLKAAEYYLQKLIEDIEEHGVPSCHM